MVIKEHVNTRIKGGLQGQEVNQKELGKRKRLRIYNFSKCYLDTIHSYNSLYSLGMGWSVPLTFSTV